MRTRFPRQAHLQERSSQRWNASFVEFQMLLQSGRVRHLDRRQLLNTLERELGETTYAFDGHVELLGDDGLQAACKIGHCGSLLFRKEVQSQ
jgi:hypothetical protein